MTLLEVIEIIGSRPGVLAAVLAVPPALVLLFGFLHSRPSGGLAPWRYIYGLLVYLVCVPGIFAFVLTAYTLFFTRQNLLEVNVLVYLLPVVSMVVTLLLLRNNVKLDDVAGFQRLSGLMVMIGMTFVTMLLISKTRIWVVFAGSFVYLILLGLVIFGLLKWGARTAFGTSED